MNNRNINLKIIIIGLIFHLLALPATIFGYANDGNDGGPHRLINKFALEKFIEAAGKDPILKKYDFMPSAKKYDLKTPSIEIEKPFTVEYDSVIRSGAWDKSDKIKTLGGFKTYDGDNYSEEGKVRNTFDWWIIEGGYNADEPEGYMALRHFYDPVNTATPYLTDLVGEPIEASAVPGGIVPDILTLQDETSAAISQTGQHISLMGENPRVNARDWALYGSKHALQDVSKALSQIQDSITEINEDEREQLFGRAWRSIGESMHLLADMTLPAHVRNDGHPGQSRWYTDMIAKFSSQYDLKADPYEEYAMGNIVIKYSGSRAPDTIDKKIKEAKTALTLFDTVATYTNANFFSIDTISGKDIHGNMITSANGKPDYPSPKLDQLEYFGGDINKTAYYERNDEIGPIKLAAVEFKDGAIYGKNEALTIDEEACDSQASRLIPLAIAANVRLMEIMIPRIGIIVDGLDGKNRSIKAHVITWKQDKEGKYDLNSPISLDGVPTDSKKALIRLSIGNETKYYRQEIINIKKGSFEISLQYIPSIKLDEYLDADPESPLTGELRITAGLDMGGIVVWSEEFMPRSMRISPDEVEMDVSSAYSFRIETAGVKNREFIWSVREQNGGKIDQEGNYRSPDTPGTFHVEAALKEDLSVKTTALVRVIVKEVSAASESEQITDDRSWMTARKEIDLLTSTDPIGTTRYGLKYYGSSSEVKIERGKPYIDGWNKIVASGFFTKRDSDNNEVKLPYWIGYYIWANATNTTPGTSIHNDPVPPGTPWQYAIESYNNIKNNDKFDYTDTAIGDLGIIGTKKTEYSTETQSVKCVAWRGPFSVTIELYGYLTYDNPTGNPSRYNLYKGIQNSDIPQDQIDIAIKNMPQTAVEIAAQMIASLDKWYFSRIADGPSVKGLYVYLKSDHYNLKDADLPDGLRVDTELGNSIYRITQTGTENRYFIYINMVDMSDSDDTASAPIRKAHDQMQTKIKENLVSKAYADTKKISFEGADEAYELQANPDNKSTSRRHLIFWRKANLWVQVDGTYTSADYAGQSPYGNKLARILLEKVLQDKSFAAPKLKETPITQKYVQPEPPPAQDTVIPAESPVSPVTTNAPQTPAQPEQQSAKPDVQNEQESPEEDITKTAQEVKKQVEDIGNAFRNIFKRK